MEVGRTPVVLSIAGSDSGGGAGIQADLKAFAALGVHGTTAITAITAQNTLGVTAIHAIPPEVIVAQVDAVVSDIGVDAVKVGMLGTRETTEAVVAALARVPPVPVVVDPVMVSESGASLLDDGARGALISDLLPLATVLTPNVPEARALAGAGEGATSVRARGGDPFDGSVGGDRHRRPRRRGGPARRRRRAVLHPGADASRRRRARVRLYAQLEPRCAAGARSPAQGSRRRGAAAGRRGDRSRPSRRRRRPGTRGCAGHRIAAPAPAADIIDA